MGLFTEFRQRYGGGLSLVGIHLRSRVKPSPVPGTDAVFRGDVFEFYGDSQAINHVLDHGFTGRPPPAGG